MRVHEFEGVGLPARWLLRPLAGVGALGVPPDRVVVEVADHEHRPAGFGDREIEFGLRAGSAHPRGAPLAGNGAHDGDGDLGNLLAGLDERLTTEPIAVDADRGPPR